ncbi:MAG TPA: VWA domain-containing protein [Balneolales bacterium]|nr:VWA domain-containing protein [Balneolales bacterium]
MIWKDPEWFWALLIIPVIIGLQVWRYYKHRLPTLTFSSVSYLKDLPGNWRKWGPWATSFFEIVGIVLVVIALARPQLENTHIKKSTKGIDIMLALDISTSMKAEDLKPSRFKAAKMVASDFIDKRPSDRIGLVIFARQSFTVCPLTLDHDLLEKLLNNVKMGVVEDGTAIGMGLATAINRLKSSKAKSKVIILLTDGQNNAGQIDPVTAADMAATFGIKIYTIGVGSKGVAPYPVNDPIFGKRYQNIKVDIDEKMLTKIANTTGGEYFRATDTKSLRKIYDQINKMEKTKIKQKVFVDYKDLYPNYLLPGILFFILAFASDKIIFRSELR